VTDVGLVVGTSAGALVGAQITSGRSLQELYARQLQPLVSSNEPLVPSAATVLALTQTAGADAADAQAARARIGTLALAVQTIAEEAYLEYCQVVFSS
jgi:NTE family protein